MAKTVDLRTYLLLERAFVRRLQRSWRQQSAPTYAKITQACLDHKWDEARRLVPDLDMAEVGTENREWITYMLLSCAVFGAGMVSKSKPSFVGVGSFDTFLKQVTNNFLMYLEFNATAQVQAEALQSIAEDEAKTKALKWEEAKHPRDKDGKFTEAQGDEGDRPVFYHGTTADSLEGILTHGFQVERAGQVWPEKSQRDRTYVTADRDDAEEWAKTAVEKRKQQQQLLQRLLGPEATLPSVGEAIAIFTVRIPDDRLQDLQKDTNFSLDPDAKQFKGSIPPEWIVEAKIGTPSDENVWDSDFKWTTVPLKKAAGDGQIIYVVMVLQESVQKYDPAQPRDTAGRWSEIRYGGAKDFDKAEYDRVQLAHDIENAIFGYVQGGARYMNEHLRAGKIRHDQQREVELLDAHMQQNRLAEDTTLTRTVAERVVNTLDVGDVFQDNGYVSTTKNSSKIEGIRKDIGVQSGLQSTLTVLAPKGLGHIDVNEELGKHGYDNQEEVILPRGTRFEVVSKAGKEMIVKVLQ